MKVLESSPCLACGGTLVSFLNDDGEPDFTHLDPGETLDDLDDDSSVVG